MTVYSKLYNLLNSWLSTKGEDYNTYSKIDGNQTVYLNGVIYQVNGEYYNNGEVFWEILNPQNAVVTSEDNSIKITTPTSGEKKVNLPVLFESTDNIFVEMTYQGGSSQPIALSFNNTSNGSLGYCNHNGTSTFTNVFGSSSSTVTGSIREGDVFRLVRLDNVTYFYQNDNLLFTGSKSFSTSFYMGFYTNQNRIQKWSNIFVGRIT